LKKIPEEVHVEDYYYKNKETVYQEVRNDFDYDYAYENARTNRVIDNNVIQTGTLGTLGTIGTTQVINNVVNMDGQGYGQGYTQTGFNQGFSGN